MALDLFFRAENLATLRTVVRSAPFRNIIGDLRARDGDGNVTSGIRMLPGSADWVYFAPASITVTPAVLDGEGNIVTPAVMDPWCWLHLRLSGSAEAADDEGENGEPDRWNRSRIKRWVKENGIQRTIRGVNVWQHTLANGKRIQIWRGSQMEALGVKFHEFMGGNSH